jgi:amino acid adenylation domain-containing protein
MTSQTDYWKKELKDAPGMVQIPTDFSRSQNQKWISAEHHFSIDLQLNEKLVAKQKTGDSELGVTFLTAFGLLLMRYSAQEELVVGIQKESIVSDGTESMANESSNLLPIRFLFQDELTFSEALTFTQRKVDAAIANQAIFDEKLIQEIKGKEATKPSDLFNVIFNFQSKPEETPVQLLEDNGFDLALFVHKGEKSLECVVTYNKELFEEESIQRLGGHYTTIVNAIFANPEIPVLKVPLLTKEEAHQILIEWNNTQTNVPKDKCIHHRFEEQVERTPDTIAVEFEGEQITYAQLNASANRLARYLISQGAGEDHSVALFVERGFDMIIGLLAISKTGATYLPLDPIYPKARLFLIVDDAKPVIMLTQHSLIDSVPETPAKLIFIDDRSAYSEESSNNLTFGNSTKPGYILYTSGSTGKPKGVPVTQHAVVNLVNSMTRLLSFTTQDILLAVTTISFDIAELEMYMPLFIGAKLVIATQETATDMDLLAEKMEESNATVFQATPVTFKMLMISGWNGKKDMKLIIGGEALPKELVRDMLPRCAGIWNSYGPTETAIYSVVRNNTMEDTVGEGYVPIGRPVDNTVCYILNKKLVPVPIGIPGELYIGGDGISPGYLNLPNMTDERFIINPFGNNPEEKIYKTGDLVTYFNDGNMVFLNRLDSQVKIRGFRIELGEIESAIAQFDAIKDNVVIVREDVPGNKKLVGYLILKEGMEADMAELRQFLNTKLPDYMVPAAFVLMDKFPVTLNGKVDRKLLPAPLEIRSQVSADYVAANTELGKTLVSIWSEVLKMENIGITDNFFELGGNSLVAAMLITRIKKVLNIKITLSVLFMKQTIAEIEKEIQNQKIADSATESTQTISHHEFNTNIFPLSPGQKRLWFVENFEPGNRAYNMPFDYTIKGDLNILILEKSINTLIERHGSLRTVIQTTDGEPVQNVLEPYPYQLPFENLENLSEAEKAVAVGKFSDENELHLFDLETGPLFIIKLLKINTTEWLLLINMHHAITDGLSVKIFMDELGLIYTALKENKPLELKALPITYPDFAIFQNSCLTNGQCATQLEYWINELKGAPDLLQLPMDFQRPKNQTYDGDEVQFTIGKEMTKQLHLFSQQNKGSLFVTMLSIFNTLISRYASQEEFLIGIPIAGRTFEEQESIVGMFINNFPLRVTPLENMTFPEMLEMCKKKFYEAYDNQTLPLDRIVEELKVTRTANISPLFQVMFNLLNMFDEEISLGGSTMEMVDKRRRIAQFDLSLHSYETKGTLNCVLEYNSNLFKRSRIERMAGHFTELVKCLMINPEQKIKKIPILTENENKVILGEWNATTVDFPREKCVHQLFEQQVLKTPDIIAIRDDRKAITYTELNEKANKLARYLHDSGALEGSLVSICMERSTDILVALLAVLKAGCTYIPLDPIYPKDRLALILEDGNPALMITEKKLLESLPETDTKNIFIEDYNAYKDYSGENADFTVTPSTVAYLIYTSGSTGKPKGVQLEHFSVVNFLASMAKKPGITSEDIVLAVTTISFDIAGLEMYLPILYGASIFVASQETSMNPDLLIQKIEESKATILQATPVTFRMLNSAEWSGAKGLKILCGGEAMPKELAYDLINKCGELWNMYGPTETTVWSTVEKVAINENDKIGYINLGKPIDNTFIYVLNTEFQPVPIGYPGELFIGGDGLARGYFNLPAMTQEKFLPDPFSNLPGARMYRTGDLVQQTEEGKLEFLNRVDSQVKIRGFRIELGEIESAISQFGTIKNNVTIVREDTPGDKKLVAYIIKEEEEVDIAELRQFLKTKIPDYMVPSAFVFIDQFPLTPNGKIDRKVLPSPVEAAPQQTKSYIAPQTETEIKLAAIWSDVLKIKQIGADEDFFEIGGHSMVAVTLMVKIEKQMGVRLPLAILFDNSTIHDMAQLIDQKSERVSWGSLVPIRSKGSKKPLYLVHGAGLNLLLYTTIVAGLDPDQPVFGLQAKGLDGVDEPLYTIEEIAAYYNEEILKIDKSGSYALAGFSMGGQLAYEMAKQLVEAGHKVSFLGVFDTVSENVSDRHIPFFERYKLRIERLFNQVTWIIGTFLKKPANKKFEFVAQKWRSMKQKITKDDYKIKHEGASLGKQSELPKYLHKVHKANDIALNRYILPPYPGKLTLFRAMHQSFYIKDPVKYGWEEYVKEMEILDIPGEHSTIFAPPNDVLFARALQKCLDERN